MRAGSNVLYSNIAATTAAFSLPGGKYAFAVVATFGGGTVTLQILGPDGVTWLTAMAAVTVAGVSNGDLPQGQYRIAVVTATAVYASLQRVPAD